MNSEDKWYYLRAGGSHGPESFGRLIDLMEEGAVDSNTLVWKEGNSDWVSLQKIIAQVGGEAPPIPGSVSSVHATATPTDSTSRPSVWSYDDAGPHPWRRYFARLLDIVLGGGAMWLIVGLILSAIDQDGSKAFLDYINKSESRIISSLLTIFLSIFPSALFVGLTRSSPGKLIFGIRVSAEDDAPIGLAIALHREFLIWIKGWGLGLPIVSLFTLINAFKGLKRDGTTSWDADLNIKVVQRHSTLLQTAISIIGVLIIFAIFAWLTSL